ncbi:MAG TPA: alkaline phosphatase family protein [Nitrososphaerales archaeon]|nr:alkaline phosphatase family protein [Nitrososphaerales archaeon]
MPKSGLARVFAVAALLPLLLLPLGSGLTGTVNAASSPSPGAFFDHVVVILMENNGYCDIITTCGGHGPYETSLASNYSIAGTCSSDSSCSIGGYTAVSHPSEPNYCALISGAIYSDCSNDSICCFQDANLNVVDRFAAAGITWQAYAEDAKGSGTCAFSAPDNDHFPYVYFSDNDVASRCANFLTASTNKGADAAFLSALNQKSGWANFIWLTPNNKDNGHDTGAAHGDEWLSDTVPGILSSYMFTHSRSALFVGYDEGNSVFPHDYIYASWSGPLVKQGYVGTGTYNHYSLLATLEANWGFAPLTSNDGTATAMSEFFK